MKLNKTTKLAFKILPWALIGLAIYFFYDTLSESLAEASKFDLSQYALLLVFSSIAFIAAVAVSGALWGKLFQRISGDQVDLREAIKVHAASWLLKYVPGQVGSVTNKVAWATKKGFSKRSAINSFVYENIFTVIASLLLSIPVIFIANDALSYAFLAVLVFVMSFVAVYRPVFMFLANSALRIFKKKQIDESQALDYSSTIRYLTGYLLPRVITGLGFVVVASSLIEITPLSAIVLASIYIFASIVGLLAFFVPGGIGVREGVIAFLLLAYLPLDQAVFLAIITRLFSTAADIGVFVVYLFMNNWRLK